MRGSIGVPTKLVKDWNTPEQHYEHLVKEIRSIKDFIEQLDNEYRGNEEYKKQYKTIRGRCLATMAHYYAERSEVEKQLRRKNKRIGVIINHSPTTE